MFKFFAVYTIGLFLLAGNANVALADQSPPPEQAAPSNTAVSLTEDQVLENQRMMAAAGKMTEVLTAQLDGDQTKLENAVKDTVAIYDEVLQANPTKVKALNGRAAVKETLKPGNGAEDYNKAIDLMTTALVANDKDALAYHDRAVAYRGLKIYDKARVDYNKAIALDPSKFYWATELKAMEIEVQ